MYAVERGIYHVVQTGCIHSHKTACDRRRCECGGTGCSGSDPEDEILFVGHSGISVKTKDGLLFIEKYGFSLPYQVSKFKDKAELKEYLMDRLDVDTSGNGAAKPIIMENDELMN